MMDYEVRVMVID